MQYLLDCWVTRHYDSLWVNVQPSESEARAELFLQDNVRGGSHLADKTAMGL